MKKQNIQFWRVVACLMVFAVHFGQRIKLEGTVREFTDYGYYGVYLFFIISGFLIANSYEKYGHADLKKYVVNRMMKLLPLYYAVILYYFIVHNFVFCDVPDDPTRFGWLRYLFLLVGIVPNTQIYFWDNLGITWTIPCFFWMYLILPFALKRLNNFWSVVLLYVLSVSATTQAWRFNGWLGIIYYIPFFILGAVIYYCMREKKQSIVGVWLGILIFVDIIKGEMDTYTYSYLFTLLIIVTESMTIENAFLNKVLTVFDKYSYTLYLAHGIIFIHILDRYEMRRLKEAAIAVVGSAVLALVINHLVEKPIQFGLKKAIEKYYLKKHSKTEKIESN